MASTPVKLKLLPRSTLKAKVITPLVGRLEGEDGELVATKHGGVWTIAFATSVNLIGKTLTIGLPNTPAWKPYGTSAAVGTITRIRDRLFVGDGVLSDGSLGNRSTHTSMPDTRAGTIINDLGGGWTAVPFLTTVYSLGATGDVGIAGMSFASLQTDAGSVYSTLGVVGMALADHPTEAVPAWGGYFEALNLTNMSNAFGIEVNAANLFSASNRLLVYGTNATSTIVIHTLAGGSADDTLPGVDYYNPAACLDLEAGLAGNCKFDRGIVFRNGSIKDQGGSNFEAIVFPNKYRTAWFRSDGASGDQIQAFIEANNTTTGTLGGRDIMGLSFGGDSGIPGNAALFAEVLDVRSATSNDSSILIGRGGSGNRAATLALYAHTADVIDAYLMRSSGVNGKLNLVQVGTGGFEVTAPGGTIFSSGAAGTISFVGVGRVTAATQDVVLGAVAAANQFAPGSAQGDGAVNAQNNLWLAANGSGTPKAIKLATTGVTTFPGDIILPGSSSGTTTIAATAAASGTLTLPAATGTLLYGGGPLGTPSSGTLTSCTGLPLSTGVTGNLSVSNLNGGTSASSSTFWRGDGTWTTPAAPIATQAEMETATAIDSIVTPGRAQFHPSACKCWVRFNSAGTIAASYNTTSITDNGAGDWTVNIGTDFSSANYSGIGGGGYVAGVGTLTYVLNAIAAGTYRILSINPAGTLTDPTSVDAVFFQAFGDQ